MTACISKRRHDRRRIGPEGSRLNKDAARCANLREHCAMNVGRR
jgi:hypothetical protein